MKSLPLALLVIWGAASRLEAADFDKPIRMEAAGKVIRVESPGYAAPCWTDLDGDGLKDLLVGQFNQGKIHVFKNLGDAKLTDAGWLQAEGDVAEIPGVW